VAKWFIDPDHSVAAFVIRHMMVTNVRGQFNKLSGSIFIDPEDMIGSSVEIAIDVSGIYTGINKRDDHLRSPDFFDVRKCPQITFKSASVQLSGTNKLRLSGELTIHGISRQAAFDVEYSGPMKSPFGEISMGFTASTVINREDFGLLWNMALDAGGFMIGKEVLIYLDIEADLSAG
jgi:polyisoprenoid-binding protein YceI